MAWNGHIIAGTRMQRQPDSGRWAIKNGQREPREHRRSRGPGRS